LGAGLNQPGQNFLAHDERCIVESTVGVWLVLAYLGFEIRLHKEVRIEFGDGWDNQMSEEFSLFAGRHHPTKRTFVLATQDGAIVSGEIFGRVPRAWRA
jgi:hypothetical protein